MLIANLGPLDGLLAFSRGVHIQIYNIIYRIRVQTRESVGYNQGMPTPYRVFVKQVLL